MRRILLIATAVSLALAGSPLSLAGEVNADPVRDRYTPAYDQCLDGPEGVSTPGMIACTVQELAVQDKALNAAYAGVMTDLNARQKAKLRAAQKAWIAFRDADCVSRQDEDWGTLSRITANVCLLRRTVERTIDLETYPDGGEPEG